MVSVVVSVVNHKLGMMGERRSLPNVATIPVWKDRRNLRNVSVATVWTKLVNSAVKATAWDSTYVVFPVYRYASNGTKLVNSAVKATAWDSTYVVFPVYRYASSGTKHGMYSIM
jgi:hypothetical protein